MTSGALLGLGLMAFGGGALAATETDTFDVTATVVPSCTVSAANLAFGNYDPTLGNNGTTTVTSNCTLATSYSLGLDFGGEADVNSRVLTGDGAGAHTLNYQLTSDLAGLVPWGAGPGDDVDLVGTGLNVPTTVYGQIASGQNVEAASYTDTITVTLTY